MNVAEVGERIRQRREQVGLRQRDIADALQLSAQAVSKWERGENAPDIGLLPDLARLLGISTDWLLAGFDDSPDLLKALERIAMGNVAAITPIDETDRLLTRLRDLVRVRNMFGQQVATKVVDAVLRGEVDLAGAWAEATIMITDIRSFTVMSRTVDPPVLIALLNRYFAAMLEVVEEFGGTLHKFLGDGMIIQYNLPLPQPDHPLLAVRSAIRIRERLVEFNRDQVARGEPALRMGMGINTGHLIAGTIGAAGRVTEYTVMGDAVNLASRLESQTKELGCDIVIGDATYQRVRDHVDVAEPVEVRVKGQEHPVRCFRLLGLKPA
ncbi:MAG TPA: adenylate/guanylate cyclase domain-containing protein [Chloroflexota bacterium]|nr:adenylate/guanylate cyclase domain-containing protein [Chloroflexota bacterium]